MLQNQKKGGGLREISPAGRGFKPHPPHHHVEIIGGFVRVISSIILRLTKDLTTIVV